jgi:hypothetical protein
MNNENDGKNPFVSGAASTTTPAASPAPLPAAVEQPVVAEPAAPPPPPAVEEQPSNSIRWSATDTSSHDRRRGWHLTWLGIILLLAGGSFAINWFFGIWQMWSTVGLAIIVFIALIIMNRQPSKAINYELTPGEITINDKKYPLSDFRAFSVSSTNNIWLLSLVPTKRVAMPFDIIIPEDKGEDIVDLLGTLMPMEAASANFADKLSSTLKF